MSQHRSSRILLDEMEKAELSFLDYDDDDDEIDSGDDDDVDSNDDADVADNNHYNFGGDGKDFISHKQGNVDKDETVEFDDETMDISDTRRSRLKNSSLSDEHTRVAAHSTQSTHSNHSGGDESTANKDNNGDSNDKPQHNSAESYDSYGQRAQQEFRSSKIFLPKVQEEEKGSDDEYDDRSDETDEENGLHATRNSQRIDQLDPTLFEIDSEDGQEEEITLSKHSFSSDEKSSKKASTAPDYGEATQPIKHGYEEAVLKKLDSIISDDDSSASSFHPERMNSQLVRNPLHSFRSSLASATSSNSSTLSGKKFNWDRDAFEQGSGLSTQSSPARISLRVEGADEDDDDENDNEMPERRRNTVAVRGGELVEDGSHHGRRRSSKLRDSYSSPVKRRSNNSIFASLRHSRLGASMSLPIASIPKSASIPSSLSSVSAFIKNQAPSTSSLHSSRQGSGLRDSFSTSNTLSRSERHSYGAGDFDANSTAAAAAAVIAFSVQAQTRRGIQFGKGDHALVQLSRLSQPELELEKELETIAPVNKYGYPAGEGKTEKQKQGPFIFVLCRIIQVHFDEDERYYTVRRYDTGAEQRADLGFDWMEPITDENDVEVALQAAMKSRRSMEDTGDNVQRESLFSRLMASPLQYYHTVVIPSIQSLHAITKDKMRDFLRGGRTFSLNLRFTCVNLLVLSSIIFIFLDIMVLAFLDAEYDHSMAILGFTVWLILVLELFFEYVIRPSNYNKLMQSDKAYSPSTARFVNWWHLIGEALALVLYIPQLPCAFDKSKCGVRTTFSSINTSLISVTSARTGFAAAGQFAIGLAFLRALALVRHWKQMWINHTFDTMEKEKTRLGQLFLFDTKRRRRGLFSIRKRKSVDKNNDLDSFTDGTEEEDGITEQTTEEDRLLKNAATIGTALMVVNSHRYFCLLLFLISVFPVIYTMDVRNPVAENIFHMLQENNVLSNTTTDCEYLRNSVRSWLLTVTYGNLGFDPSHRQNSLSIQFARVLPIRCKWQKPDGVITRCLKSSLFEDTFPACDIWDSTIPADPLDATTEYFASVLQIRQGELTHFQDRRLAPASFYSVDPAIDVNGLQEFQVDAIFNQSHTVAIVNFALVLLLISMVMLVLIGLSVMRGDAARLVLLPIQRMLKIVVRYAENPLYAPTETNTKRNDDSSEELGHFETEQLINAISKIADLLRKCWGVAGAGIISSNLARTKTGKTVVFNPTIPGKRVYALFGFVGINEFDKQLRSLDKDIMKLINDVARVVHDEVYRWSLGGSGQCNKNLGGAFLMVFRIGDFTEVHDRKKRATDVIFNTQMRKGVKVRQRGVSAGARKLGASRHFDITSDGTLQLASLPGIQGFTDRALLGFLKTFAGLYRDQNMQKWEKDFRLSAGVGKFKINVIYGMDAGWAVEGAVGSEYKIDATYLSPHVNMASRMMSACKQYGVTLLLSQAVEELLSKPARKLMRHLDTVYVKGSNVAQRIYTYDARYAGVDFFLFERSPEQADVEADAYNPSIWEKDQDLKAMRQHVSEEFHNIFKKGVEQYIEGEWASAIKTLQDADEMMLRAVVESGYVDYDYGEIEEEDLLNLNNNSFEIDRIRNEYGDGACKCLVQYMQRRNGVPPADWHGVRKLDSK